MWISEGEGDAVKPTPVAKVRKFLKQISWCDIVQRRIPITSWIRTYSLSLFLQDMLAGFTVGLTEIPQGIAYAGVASLEPQYGLYAGFMGCFVYTIMGSCKDINIGPTAIMALMVQHHVEAMGPDIAVLLSFISGLIIFILGLLHLGFLVEFISFPVTAGFTSAASITIASTQVKGLLGIKGKGNEFLEAWEAVFENIGQTNVWDAVLGFTAIVTLFLMRSLRKWANRESNPEFTPMRNFMGKVCWLTSLARNAFVVVVGTLLSFILSENGISPFNLTGKIGEGLPPLQPPPFSIVHGNHTYNFSEISSQLSFSIIFVPLVAILETIAIAKAFSKGKTVDATQEMLALGICNLTGSFVRSMPITGSFTRTAVNNASGVKTTLGGVLSGIMVLLALGLLTSTFYFIPKAVLAAVVITAMFYLFDFEAIALFWRTKKLDLVPFSVTLFSALFLGLEYGIIIGIGTNLLFVLHKSARPTIMVDKIKISHGDVVLVTLNRGLHFPAAEYVREKILKDSDCGGLPVIIDGKCVGYVDTTVAKNLSVLAEDLVVRNQRVVFWEFKPKIKDVCVGIDPKMNEYFREGNIEDLIDDSAISTVQSSTFSVEDSS